MPLHSLRSQNLHDKPPLVNLFHHPSPVTTLLGSSQSQNLFQISAPATSRQVRYGITVLSLAQLDTVCHVRYWWGMANRTTVNEVFTLHKEEIREQIEEGW